MQWRLSIGGSHSVLNGELKDTFFDDLDDYNDAYTSTGRGSVEGSFEGVFSPLVGVELIYPISSALDAKIGVRTQYRGWTETSSGYLNTTPFVSDDGTEVIGTSEFEQSLSFQMRYWDIPIGIVYELNDFIDLEFAMFTSMLVSQNDVVDVDLRSSADVVDWDWIDGEWTYFISETITEEINATEDMDDWNHNLADRFSGTELGVRFSGKRVAFGLYVQNGRSVGRLLGDQDNQFKSYLGCLSFRID